jgi:hypothetical protein
MQIREDVLEYGNALGDQLLEVAIKRRITWVDIIYI